MLHFMIERNSEMEKLLKQVLLDAGETSLLNWDDLFVDVIALGSNSKENAEIKHPVKNNADESTLKVNSAESIVIVTSDQLHG